jgi:nitroimidazol reductase NimA-like FMN-containing flavoprotein (pyridoxamine 5'-phosphate oxidase superfamily)
MSVVKLPWMSGAEVDALIGTQIMCRIAFKGDEYPYLAPFRYVPMGGNLYFHFTDYGKKMRFLKRDGRCCVQIERYLPDLSSYSFVSLRGRLKEVTNPEERKKAVALFRESGRTLSTRFLAAHGLDPGDGWGAFTADKDLVIVKLVDVAERVGLKNP